MGRVPGPDVEERREAAARGAIDVGLGAAGCDGRLVREHPRAAIDQIPGPHVGDAIDGVGSRGGEPGLEGAAQRRRIGRVLTEPVSPRETGRGVAVRLQITGRPQAGGEDALGVRLRCAGQVGTRRESRIGRPRSGCPGPEAESGGSGAASVRPRWALLSRGTMARHRLNSRAGSRPRRGARRPTEEGAMRSTAPQGRISFSCDPIPAAASLG